jgi:hypothetical protein
MKKLIVAMAITATAIIVAAAEASAGDQRMKGLHHPKTIQGVYGWTGPVRCISTTPDGFNETGTPLDTNTLSTMSTTSQGTITFKRNGTGMVQFTGVSTTDSPPEGASASRFKASYLHTYKISDDGAISIDALPPGLVQTILTGPNQGAEITIDTWDYTGWVSADQNTIVIATPKPTVQQLLLNLPNDNYFQIGSVICHASHTLVRLSD